MYTDISGISKNAAYKETGVIKNYQATDAYRDVGGRKRTEQVFEVTPRVFPHSAFGFAQGTRRTQSSKIELLLL